MGASGGGTLISHNRFRRCRHGGEAVFPLLFCDPEITALSRRVRPITAH